jgi:hypothetical protein
LIAETILKKIKLIVELFIPKKHGIDYLNGGS